MEVLSVTCRSLAEADCRGVSSRAVSRAGNVDTWSCATTSRRSTRSATAPTSSPTSSRWTSTASARSRWAPPCGWWPSSRCCRSTARLRTAAALVAVDLPGRLRARPVRAGVLPPASQGARRAGRPVTLPTHAVGARRDGNRGYGEHFAALLAEGADVAGEARLVDALVVRRARILDVGSGHGTDRGRADGPGPRRGRHGARPGTARAVAGDVPRGPGASPRGARDPRAGALRPDRGRRATCSSTSPRTPSETSLRTCGHCWLRTAASWRASTCTGSRPAAGPTRPTSSSPTRLPPGSGSTGGSAATSCIRPTTSTPSGCCARLRSERDEVVVGQRVEDVVGQRDAAAACWPAAPRSGRRSRGRRRPPGRRRWRCRWRRHRTCSDSGPASRTRKPQVQQVSGAAWASGASGPPSPSYHRSAARSRPSSESVRTRPRPRSLATLRTCALSSAVERVVAEGVRRHEPRVVLLDGQQVARGEVAGLEPLPVGHPRRRDDRVVAGDQHDLVDGTAFWRRRGPA